MILVLILAIVFVFKEKIYDVQQQLASCQVESPRVCRRLNSLSGFSNEDK